jgi:hypothetical protein
MILSYIQGCENIKIYLQPNSLQKCAFLRFLNIEWTLYVAHYNDSVVVVNAAVVGLVP